MKFPAVFADVNRRTCIALGEQRGRVVFIPQYSSGFQVCKLGAETFARQYDLCLTEYPVKRAAELYLKAATLFTDTTAEARRLLTELVKDKTLSYDVEALLSKPVEGVTIMATAKKPAAKKAAPKKPAAKAAPKKPVAKKAAPTKVSSAPKKPAATAGRRAIDAVVQRAVPKKPNGPDIRVITVLAKENPKREGTSAHDIFANYKSGMSVEAFYKAGGNATALAYDAKKGFISLK